MSWTSRWCRVVNDGTGGVRLVETSPPSGQRRGQIPNLAASSNGQQLCSPYRLCGGSALGGWILPFIFCFICADSSFVRHRNLKTSPLSPPRWITLRSCPSPDPAVSRSKTTGGLCAPLRLPSYLPLLSCFVNIHLLTNYFLLFFSFLSALLPM